MESKQPEPVTRSSRWSLLVVRWIAFGFGSGIGLAFVLIATFFYFQRPAAWNTRALRVKSVRVEPISNLDENLKATSQGDLFTVDLENTTSADVTLPAALTVMQMSKKNGALHGSFLKADKDYFVPAHHVRRISLDDAADHLCDGNADAKTCFGNYFADDSEVVIFDKSQKYEIHIPIPPLTLPSEQADNADKSSTMSSESYAPDRGKPWERYGACADGLRLAHLCKQARIALDAAKLAANGWIPVGSLPTLPKAPNGLKIDPDEQTCRTAYDWDSYCHNRLK